MSLDLTLDMERAIRRVHMAVYALQFSPVEEAGEHWGSLVSRIIELNDVLPGDFYARALERLDDDELVPTFVTGNTPPEDIARAVFESFLAGRTTRVWLANFVSSLTTLRTAVEMLQEHCPHYDASEQRWSLP